MKKSLPEVPNGNLLLYQTEDGKTRIEVRLQGETVWLSLNQTAELFHRDKSVISRHIRNIFEEWELPPQLLGLRYGRHCLPKKGSRRLQNSKRAIRTKSQNSPQCGENVNEHG